MPPPSIPVSIPILGCAFVVSVALISTGFQAWLSKRIPSNRSYFWGALLSFSTAVFSTTSLIQYHQPPPDIALLSEKLQYTSFIFMVHGLTGFGFTYHGEPFRLNRIFLLLEAVLIPFLWLTGLFLAEEVTYKYFSLFDVKYPEPSPGPLGSLYLGLNYLAALVSFGAWLKRQRRTEQVSLWRDPYVIGFTIWLLTALHDVLATLVMPSFLYLMSYGVLGFNIAVMFTIIRDFEHLRDSIMAYQEDLEEQVRSRTADLEQANHRLSNDIDKRMKAEEALRLSEEKFRLVVENANEGIVVIQDSKYKFINQWMLDLLKTSREEALSREIMFAVHPEDRQRILERVEKRLAGESVEDVAEHRLFNSEGGLIWIEARGILSEWNGRPASISFASDITYRKKAQEDLRESEQRYRTVSELTSDFSYGYRIESDGEFVNEWVTGALTRLTGYSKEELRSLGGWEKLIHPDDLSIPVSQLKALLSNRINTVEYRILTKDGRVRWMRDYARPTWSTREDRVVRLEGAVQDITERKKAQEAVARNEATLNSFIKNIPGLAFLKNESGEYLFVNQSFLEEAGLEEAGQVIGRDDRELFDPETAKAFTSHDEAVRESGTPMTFEEILEVQGLKRTYLTVKFPIEGPQGSIGMIGGVSFDITQRLEMEQEREELAIQLRQAQKMEALGTLAGGIAHDFNNILAAIIGYSELALIDLGENKRLGSSIEEILKASNRAKDLVTQILTFSRKLEPELKTVDLNRVVNQTQKMLERTIPRMITIQDQLADGLWQIKADPNQLSQVLLNLGANAKDAMPEGGKLTIETGNVVLDQTFCDQHAEASPGEYVHLTVSDTGHGMDKDILEHIFDPFFTKKDVGRGTGLGLATVYGIIKNHGGFIISESIPGEGSTFRIFLPGKGVRGQALSSSGKDGTVQPGGDETILLVDDEEAIRELGRQFLSFNGYRILTAATGEEALEIYETRGREIDLVILDISMPGMGGQKCLQGLLGINPQAKVIIASGYSLQGQLRETLDLGATRYVAKPFTQSEMLKTVREVLDAPDT